MEHSFFLELQYLEPELFQQHRLKVRVLVHLEAVLDPLLCPNLEIWEVTQGVMGTGLLWIYTAWKHSAF